MKRLFKLFKWGFILYIAISCLTGCAPDKDPVNDTSPATFFECSLVASFAGSHDETTGNIGVGLVGETPMVYSKGSSTKTVDDYYTVFENNEKYYLAKYKAYDLYVLLSYIEKFELKERYDSMFGTIHSINGYRIELKSLTKEEADAYAKAVEGGAE